MCHPSRNLAGDLARGWDHRVSRRSKRGMQPDGPFVQHSLKMRVSYAWRFLPANARLVVGSLEVEHMQQGGAENGRLKRTYADFERDGVPRKGIALAIRQAEALGFVVVAFRARPSIAEFRRCSEFRLTYLSGRGPDAPAMTHEWRRIQSEEQAIAALREAETIRSPEHVRKAVDSMPKPDPAALGRRQSVG